jgi:RNA polymerase sigma factor (sigma-70 family)
MEDRKLIDGLKEKSDSAFRTLYEHYYPTIERFVVSNSGNKADAEDVFQEMILVMLHKVPSGDFTLTASIKTYVYAVASNIWLKKLRDGKKNIPLPGEVELEDFSLSEWESHDEERYRNNIIARIFNRVTRHCMIFLTKTFIKGVSREKLMQELGYKNLHTFDNQKYKCLQQARKNS